MKKDIMISRSRSSFNIFLNKEAVELLGGIGAAVLVSSELSDRCGHRITVSRTDHKGSTKNTKYAMLSRVEATTWEGRIQLQQQKLDRIGFDLPPFGPHTTSWTLDEGISFYVPSIADLDPPAKRKKRKSKSPELSLDHEDKWGKLSRVIREFNEILSSYDEVDFFIPERFIH